MCQVQTKKKEKYVYIKIYKMNNNNISNNKNNNKKHNIKN